MTRFAALIALIALLAGCQNATPQNETPDAAALSSKEAVAAEEAKAAKTEHNAPITETAVPNKPASPDGGAVANDDLAALKAELNALNADISKMRGDLTGDNSMVVASTTTVTPDTQISTPRRLMTDGVVSIPDSKSELAAIEERASVEGVRVGVHRDSNMTRLVLDIDRISGQNPAASADGNQLKIKLFKTVWPNWDTQTSSLGGNLGVFNVSEQGQDTIVTITTGGPVIVKSNTVLPPSSIGGPQRVVIDVAPKP